MERSSIILLAIAISIILAIVTIWNKLIPNSIKEAFSPPSKEQKQQISFIKDNIDEVIFITKKWPIIAQAASNGKIDEAFCVNGNGEEFWGEEYHITCIALILNQHETCYHLKDTLADDKNISLKIRQCIEHVSLFSTQQLKEKVCEGLRDFSLHPEDYINCRAWIDKRPETCLYIAQYKDDTYLRYTQTVTCMVNLARHTRHIKTCDSAREFYNKYKDYLNNKIAGAAVDNCYKFK